jgi:hypothetical protein
MKRVAQNILDKERTERNSEISGSNTASKSTKPLTTPVFLNLFGAAEPLVKMMSIYFH